MVMGRATWGKLTQAWPGEARDFTPELARHLDLLDRDLGLGLADAQTEVAASGGRRIDIVASGGEGTYVIENQYGRADHDHLTRGLAYAVSADAAGLIVVAEEHRDEFREVAHYLNDVAARAGQGIKVWLVEAKAVRVDDSRWAPVFEVVAQPSLFTQEVAGNLAGYERRVALADVLEAFASPQLREAALSLIDAWKTRGLPSPGPVVRGGVPLLSFGAPGPSRNGWRTVLTAYADGRIYISFSAFSGKNSGVPIEPLASEEFVQSVSDAFGLEKGYSPTGWLTPDRVPMILGFADTVISAYRDALNGVTDDAEDAADRRTLDLRLD